MNKSLRKLVKYAPALLLQGCIEAIPYVICTIVVALGCFILVGCGGGACDADCKSVLAQAHGEQTVQPVECAASASCD